MEQPRHISLSKLQSLIKSRLEEAMPVTFWVAAEISEMKVNYSGHCYIELVEKGGADQIPQARVSAVIWRSSFGAISSYFHSATGQELSEGMKVLLKGKVSYHQVYGLSLNISDIDPAYTLGDMERQRRETVARLREEGVFDMNRELEIPAVVQRIAVISSRNAAGHQDFMNELGSAGYIFQVALFDAFMQGNATEESVIGALEAVAERMDEFDALVIIRGGGSQSDLAAFDSYRLSSHVAQFPLPVLAGIGHDKDTSVTDMVAAVSLKTPTAVAAYLVDGLARAEARLDSLRDSVVGHADQMLEQRRRALQSAGIAVTRVATELTKRMELRLEKLTGTLRLRQQALFTACDNKIENLSSLLRRNVAENISRENARLELSSALIESRRPERVLALGFSIVKFGGKTLGSAADVEKGDMVDIILADGALSAQVTDKSSEGSMN